MSAHASTEDNAALRSDVRKLGELLGQSLARQDGEALLNLVELVRKSVREGNGEDLLKSISTSDSVKLVRAFNVYFNLANVAEQVHRSRVLAEERRAGGSWLSRAVEHIINARKSGQQFSDAELRSWLENFEVRPVFTAHPTEAARRSVLSKLSTISELLDQPESDVRERRLAEAVDLLWQTDELRLGRPEHSMKQLTLFITSMIYSALPCQKYSMTLPANYRVLEFLCHRLLLL